jgi:hypothetical protein
MMEKWDLFIFAQFKGHILGGNFEAYLWNM